MNTKERIIQASLELFNESGERAVTTNHIAFHLDMSPGNLYYHFRNKEKIIEAILERYMDYINNSITYPDPRHTAEEFLRGYCEQVFGSIWKYRFLHAHMPDLLKSNRNLHGKYLQTHRMLSERACAAIYRLKKDGIIQVEKERIQELVVLMRLVTGSWVSYCIANTLEGKITLEMVKQGVLMLMALIEPYATREGHELFHKLRLSYRSDVSLDSTSEICFTDDE